ncbi:MAG: sulfite exporter TauE/SafE family protein [Rhodospirillales bacterium]|jgi:uncharacterized membrane protein YfcA|nr:sulfite exporter TauE/SafE family protein [Rhodospirillales bacterium]
MQVYLPIAEMSVNFLLILGMGGGVGFLSGLFGVGGGFLMTPLLMFIGISPAIAVATGANQIVAASVSAAIAHWRRGNVDLKMGSVLLVGGILGSGFGVWLFTLLREIGQLDLVITISYVIFLGVIGGLMFVESVRAAIRRKRQVRRRQHTHLWIHGLPFKTRFRRSRLYISVLPPIGIGFLVGVLGAVMGVGGGFVMVPAMIYLLGMPTTVVIGTSLFQIVFVMANVTVLQAITNQTVDIMLALVLLIGAVIGAQFGARAGAKMPGDQLRVLLAALVLTVCGQLVFDLVATPSDLYSLGIVGAK